jgi:hypothetical protein
MGRAIARCYDTIRGGYEKISILLRGTSRIMTFAVIRIRVAMRLAANDIEPVMVARLVHQHVQTVAEYGDAAINGQQHVAQ